MRRLLFIAVVALSSAGCTPSCGTFTHHTGLEVENEGEIIVLDDYELYEVCGSKMGGSFGNKDLLGDGIAWVLLDGTHKDLGVAIAASIFLDVYFPTADLAPGASVDLVESSAYVLDTSGNMRSPAAYTEGTLEILDARETDGDAWGNQDFRMRWDLVWGEPGVSEFWYTAEGEDWVPMQP